jgi:hypothetical protein
LTAKCHRIDELEEESSEYLKKILKFISPFRVILGFFGLFISCLIFGSLALTSLDRVKK